MNRKRWTGLLILILLFGAGTCFSLKNPEFIRSLFAKPTGLLLAGFGTESPVEVGEANSDEAIAESEEDSSTAITSPFSPPLRINK